MAIRILLADPHVAFREGMRVILEKEEDLEVVGEAGNGRAAVELVAAVAPDVVIMDVTMPILNGIDATRRMMSERPDLRIVAMSSTPQRRDVLQMLEAGACGFVLKINSVVELIHAIRAVARRQSYLCPEAANAVVGICAGREEMPLQLSYRLGGREREILQLLAEGKTSKEMASSLHISVKTVEAHRRNIMGKLDLHSVAELTKYAVREGLTAL